MKCRIKDRFICYARVAKNSQRKMEMATNHSTLIISTYLRLNGEKSRTMYQKDSNLLKLLVVWREFLAL